jgi:hypothetical protein
MLDMVEFAITLDFPLTLIYATFLLAGMEKSRTCQVPSLAAGEIVRGSCFSHVVIPNLLRLEV